MKLQDQVITIDQAKRLKELGVVQESIFTHIEFKHYNDILLTPYVETRNYINSYSAFTVAELGVMLPNGYDTMRTIEGWRGYDLDGNDIIPYKYYPTEAQARAAYLIHLLETGELSVEIVKGRLGA